MLILLRIHGKKQSSGFCRRAQALKWLHTVLSNGYAAHLGVLLNLPESPTMGTSFRFPRGPLPSQGLCAWSGAIPIANLCALQPFVLDESEDAPVRLTALASGNPVCLAVKDDSGRIIWIDHCFQHLVSPGTAIIGLTTKDIWRDQHGDAIYHHDLEVSSGKVMFVEKTFGSAARLKRRFAIRFPMGGEHNRGCRFRCP